MEFVWNKHKALKEVVMRLFLMSGAAASYVLAGISMALHLSGWAVFVASGVGIAFMAAYGDRRSAEGYVNGSIAFLTGKKDAPRNFTLKFEETKTPPHNKRGE